MIDNVTIKHGETDFATIAGGGSKSTGSGASFFEAGCFFYSKNPCYRNIRKNDMLTSQYLSVAAVG